GIRDDLVTGVQTCALPISPLQAGLAFLPLSAAAMLGSGAIASQLLPRVPPRALMVPAFLVAAAGMTLLTQLHVSSGYVTHILPRSEERRVGKEGWSRCGNW